MHFQYKAIVVVQVQTGDDYDVPRELYYSTMHNVNELRPESFRVAAVTSREADDDSDGLVDRLILKFALPIKDERVYGVQALIFLNYRLQNHVKVDMESLAYVHHDAGLPASSYSSRGDLMLRQNMPMNVEQEFTALYSNDDLLGMDMNEAAIGISARNSNIMNILERYKSRDIATDYLERFPVWTRHAGEDKDNMDTFDLRVTIDVPRLQQVIFVPTLQEVLLEAWMRYLSLLVIAVYLMRRLFHFVYTNRIANSHIKIDKLD